MPYIQPSVDSVHINVPLTNMSVAYMQQDTAFVAPRAFPVVPVSSRSNAYYVYDRGDFNRVEMAVRAPSTESAGGGFRLSRDTYNADVRAVHKDIDDQSRGNQDSVLDLEMSAVRYITRQGMLEREIDWTSKYFKTGVWTFQADGASARSSSFDPTGATANDLVHWNNADSTPIEDVRLLKRHILEETGFMPNTLTLGRPVFDALVDHPDIVGRLDRGQTTGPVMATNDSLAALFELGAILVMDGIRNTAAEGQTASHSFIGGKHALLSYRPATPGLMEPSAGYTFVWTGYLGSVAEGIEITRFYDQKIKSTRIEAEMAYDHKVVSADMGAFFNGIVA